MPISVLGEKTDTRVSLKNVLFATDFSATAQAALPYALAISRHYGSMLHAVHVIPDFDILVHAQASDPVTFEKAYDAEKCVRLEQMRDLGPDLEEVAHRTHIRHGKVWEAVSHIISAQDIDLLVLGTRGRGGIEKLVMGSVAEELLRQARCPVLTVGPKASGRVKEEFDAAADDIRVVDLELRQILLALDFNPASLRAAPFAISLAEEFQARLGLLYVIEHAQLSPRQLILERFEELLPAQSSLGSRPEKIVKCGSVPDEILAGAAECQADMIVLGVRAAKAPLTGATHFPWSTAHRVIANADCPVLTVRA
jgi:nucleotide-binding universal stress UspA family protein